MSTSQTFNMDCLEYMKTVPDKYFDLAICDPPYGIGEDGGKKRSGWVRQKNGNKIYVKDGQYEKRNWDKTTPSDEYFEELFRVSRNQIVFGVNYMRFPFPGGRIIWDKCNDGSDQSDAEIAFCSFSKGVRVFRYMWRGMFQAKSVSEGTVQQGNKRLNEKRIHPCQKPVALYEWVFSQYAKPGDKVLDTHLGSGSSRIAAYEVNLDFVGCEIDPFYYETEEARFDLFVSQYSIFTDGAFEEVQIGLWD